MDSKFNVKINICMLVCIALVLILTFFPMYSIKITAGTEFGGTSSTLSFSLFSASLSDTVSLFGVQTTESRNISLIQAYEYLNAFTSNEYCAYDMCGMTEAMGTVAIASTVIVVLYIITIVFLTDIGFSKKLFICPYWLIVHCLLIGFVPICVAATLNAYVPKSLVKSYSVSFAPFAIVAICISVLSSVVHIYVKMRNKDQ